MNAIIRVKEYVIEGTDQQELRGIANELFSQHCYYFETKKRAPVIVDLGAHVGVACLYFKSIYPAAKITAVEPYPLSFSLLEKNLASNALYDVTTVPALIGKENGKATMYVDRDQTWFSTSSIFNGAWNGSQKMVEVEVPMVRLADILPSNVDLLKIDIEGAEFDLFDDPALDLGGVEQIIMEVHPSKRREPGRLERKMIKKGFAVRDRTIHSKKKNSLQLWRLTRS